MEEKVIKYLSQFTSLSKEDIQIISTQNFFKDYAKGSFLLKEGQTSKESYLVLQGCVRSYYLKDGNEINIDFFLENDPIIPVSYNKNTPSEYFIECLEDSMLSTGSIERTDEFLKAHPRFEPLCRMINGDMLATKQVSMDRFRNLTPEEHYLEIRKVKPEWLERIPQYHLASYLGIKPQSLSRIRKRLTQKD